MKEERYHLMMDENEQGILIRALNELRNALITEEKATDAVDDLILKTAYAPTKRMRCGREMVRYGR